MAIFSKGDKSETGHVENALDPISAASPVATTNEDPEKARSVTTEDIHAEKNQAQGRTQGMDAAMEFLAMHGDGEDITDEENRAVRWKIDSRLMPMMMCIYFLQQLDKASLSYSSVFGIRADANLVGQDYSWLSSIVYFAQLLFQPLSVYALVRMPVNVWVSICFCTWGALEALLAAAHNFAGLAVVRFLLGGAEASISPTFIIITSMWWSRREQPLRMNIWYSMNGMSQILGSLLCYGLGHIKSDKLKPYQIIFLTCGLLTLACAIPISLMFPSRPTKARFLNDNQKRIALERVRHNNTGTQNTEFKWSQVIEALTDPKSWLWTFMIFCISLVSGGISSFGPLILQGFGLSSFQTILYNMIPGAIAIVSNMLSAYAVMHFKRKSIVLFVVSLFPLAGASALYALPHTTENKHTLLAVYFILQVYNCVTSLIFSWQAANTAGHTKKTTTTGMILVGLCTGNIVGPQLYQAKDAPQYHRGLIANMICLIMLSAFVVIQGLYLAYLNRRNVKRRIANGKSGEVVDYSLEASSKWAGMRAKQAEKDAAEGGATQNHTSQAFMDLTDLQNEDFVYSI
ncbi:hypothetical protein CI109_102178 [Kwoniella shandongensis]|uniref:Uncharacterized protein n=1 Tax=Kwoniella shandongensis TaxID=1734106 RepID=A0A5M6BYS8_9TREE|nr:uncharacterized protein CI109_003663 [Kwoniella shandongensis]KAA5528008.1 hypothetical protein CI109_003663 [Kwoniella shandongensis]